MGPILERILAFVVARILTVDVIKGSEKEFIVFLRGLANKNSEAVIFNAFIDALAIAFGVDA